jgi:DNA-binding response OmpR family regulator
MSAGTGSPVTILIVDDDAAMRRFLETLLTHTGYRPIGAGTAADALAAMAAPPGGEGAAVGAVLLDALLPDMRGFDLARRLVQTPATAGVPICFLSGALSGRPAPEAGIACILKPALPRQVTAALESVLGSAPATVEARLVAIAAVERLSIL